MGIVEYTRFLSYRIRRLFMPPPAETCNLAVWRRDNPTCVFKDTCGLADVSVGQYVTLLEGARVRQATIDDYSYVGRDSCLVKVSIGKFCSLGPNVQIGLGRHPTREFISTYPAFYAAANTGCAIRLRDDTIFDEGIPKTELGHDIWIGTDVIIPGGIHIGTGAVIAAGAVVVKDVAPYAVVGGNPAKVIRYRFEREEIERLLASKWWEWPIERVRELVDAFASKEAFFALPQLQK